MGLSKEDRDYLGRWQAKESDEYNRLSSEIVTQIQGNVARYIRDSRGSLDCWEDRLLKDLGEYCLERGVSDEDIEVMKNRLRENRELDKYRDAPFDERNVDELPVNSDSDHEALQARVPGPGLLSRDVWVISQTRGGASETLHQVGHCWRVPGVHFVHFHVLDSREEVMTNLDKDSGKRMYNRVCRDCFPKGLSAGVDSETDSNSSSSES